MRTIAVGVLGFAAGAVAGALFVRWYVMTHPGSLAAEKLGALFDEGSTGQKVVVSLGGLVDSYVQQ